MKPCCECGNLLFSLLSRTGRRRRRGLTAAPFCVNYMVILSCPGTGVPVSPRRREAPGGNRPHGGRTTSRNAPDRAETALHGERQDAGGEPPEPGEGAGRAQGDPLSQDRAVWGRLPAEPAEGAGSATGPPAAPLAPGLVPFAGGLAGPGERVATLCGAYKGASTLRRSEGNLASRSVASCRWGGQFQVTLNWRNKPGMLLKTRIGKN